MNQTNKHTLKLNSKFSNRRTKLIAICLNAIFLYQIIYPAAAWALTSGPSQPEVQSFEPVNTTDMVDLFSGDFNYNIPLLDVEGYPINISYHGGITADQEASWVGLGWNINPGVINRSMRGLPDDFNGDELTQELDTRPNEVIGGGINAKFEFLGKKNPGGKATTKTKELVNKLKGEKNKSKELDFDLGVSLGIRYNNYKGYGLTIGFSPSTSMSKEMQENIETILMYKNWLFGGDIKLKKSKKENTISTASASLNFDSQNGADVELNYRQNLSKLNSINDNNVSSFKKSTDASISFNSRTGFKKASLATNENGSKKSSSFTLYNSYTHSPYNKNVYRHWGISTHVHFGPEMAYFHFGWGANFSYSFQNNKHNGEERNIRGYGAMYHNEVFAEKDRDNFVFDYNRFKDGPVGSTTPFLPYATLTPDYYSVSGQGTGGSFKLKHRYVPVVYDDEKRSYSTDFTGGYDFGAGAYAKFGWDIEVPFMTSRQGVRKLDHSEKHIFTEPLKDGKTSKPYFKNMGEMNGVDMDYRTLLKGDESYSPYAFRKKNRSANPTFKKADKDPQNSVFQYLTLSEIRDDNNYERPEFKIQSYPINSIAFLYAENGPYDEVENGIPVKTGGVSNVVVRNQMEHHIASVSVLGQDGSTYQYGIPAMNTKQVERTFSIQGATAAELGKGLVTYETDGSGTINYQKENKKIVYYNQKQTTPKYAHSYLLTGVKSPDYIDVGQDGITDDDYGSAVRINYTRTAEEFKWRTPTGLKEANLQCGTKSNKYDDKASYVYGEKEIWYMHSVETKNFIALFHLSLRGDGLGVKGENGDTTSDQHLYQLDKIELFNKADVKFNKEDAVPIKTVHFTYDNSQCQNTPNSRLSGKLTLKEIYFTYGKSEKGRYTGYKFDYSKKQVGGSTATVNPNYNIKSYDRWGNYAEFVNVGASPTNSSPLTNSEFPYTTQDKAKADDNAMAWSLTHIELPSGGTIQVTYESDDYAYVQDREAMQMFNIVGVGKDAGNFNPSLAGDIREMPLYENNFNKGAGNRQNYNYMFFKRKKAGDDIEKYFNKIDTIYFSTYMRIMEEKGENFYEFVSGFAPIVAHGAYDAEYGWVQIEQVSITEREVSNREVNSIVKTGMNYAMSETPEYVFKGSNPKQSDYTAWDGLITAFGEFKNFFYSRYKTLMDRGYCQYIMTNKSYMRLNTPDGFKYGGGARVKRIELRDNWKNMQTNTSNNYVEGVYGQEYDYTTQNIAGETISSGVASFEPQIGDMENVFKQPIVEVITKNNNLFRGKTSDVYKFVKADRLQKKTYLYHIGPVGEEFYPSASVGYSKVTVKDLAKANGKTVSDFYTTKDFPTIVKPGIVSMYSSDGDSRGLGEGSGQTLRNASSILVKNTLAKMNEMGVDGVKEKLLKIMNRKKKDKDEVEKAKEEPKNRLDIEFNYDFKSCFQGYTIINNDMNGKLKKQTVYAYSPRDKKDMVKSSVEYFYLTNGNQLSNEVRLYDYKDNSISNGIIGEDMDVTYDRQDDRSFSVDPALEQNLDASGMPIPGYTIKFHADKSQFKSRVMTKLISKTGVLSRVVATEDGASVSTHNLLYDKYTGEVLLTATQNEFNDYVFNLSLPAWYATEHRQMGHAYNNWGEEGDIKTASDGAIINPNGYLSPGDELLVYNSFYKTKAWVHENNGILYLLGMGESVFIDQKVKFKITRSGSRNLLNVPMGNYVLMENPMKTDHLEIPDQKVLNASAALFSENWQPYAVKGEYNICTKFNSIGTAMKSWVKYLTDTPTRYATDYLFAGNTNIPAAFSSLTCSGHAANAYKVEKSAVDGTTKYKYKIGYLSGDEFTECPCFIDIELPKSTCTTEVETTYCFISEKDKLDYFIIGTDTFYMDSLDQAYIYIPNNNGTLSTCSLETTDEEGIIHVQRAVYVTKAMYDAMNVIADPNIYTKQISTHDNVICNPYDYSNIISIDTAKASILPGIPQTFIVLVVLSGGVKSTLTVRTAEDCFTIFDDCCTRCTDKANLIVNPYLAGTKGIWRKKADFAYHGKRKITQVSGANRLDLRQDGVFETFDQFWTFNTVSKKYSSSGHSSNWQQASEVTAYSPHGNEIENKDALGIYSSAIFGYNHKLPIAVAKNAKYTQIGFDGFEDYGNLPANCDNKHLNFLFWSSTASLDSTNVHSGKYSMRLEVNDSNEITRDVNPAGFERPVSSDPARVFSAKADMIRPFNPDTGTYLIGAWVREDFGDAQALQNKYTSAYIKVVLKKSCNDNNPLVYKFYASGPVIEGWQRIESKFTIPAGYNYIDIKTIGAVTKATNFDDIRIHPYYGNMKTYVFDQKSMKLMAELDENNYASFYEYDAEGQMIRVKKETIKGVVTLKEVRMGLKKK